MEIKELRRPFAYGISTMEQSIIVDKETLAETFVALCKKFNIHRRVLAGILMEDIVTLRGLQLFFNKQGMSVVKFVMKQEPWNPHLVTSAWEDLMILNEQTSGLESALAAIASCSSEATPPNLESQRGKSLEEYRLKKLTEHLQKFDVSDTTIAEVIKEIRSIQIFRSFFDTEVEVGTFILKKSPALPQTYLPISRLRRGLPPRWKQA